MVERSADWIDQAEGDLEHAKHDLKFGFYNRACFSAQQSAEKAVKAVLQKLGAEAWGHSVYDLLIHLKEKEPVGVMSSTIRSRCSSSTSMILNSFTDENWIPKLLW